MTLSVKTISGKIIALDGRYGSVCQTCTVQSVPTCYVGYVSFKVTLNNCVNIKVASSRTNLIPPTLVTLHMGDILGISSFLALDCCV